MSQRLLNEIRKTAQEVAQLRLELEAMRQDLDENYARKAGRKPKVEDPKPIEPVMTELA